jgi:uncharacterized protein (TIGR02246 family)
MGIGLPATLIWIVLSLAAWLDPQLAQDEWWLLLSSAPILWALTAACRMFSHRLCGRIASRIDNSLCLKAMLWVAAAVFGPAAGMAQYAPTAETCAPITSDEVEVLFARWAKALRTGHPDRVTRNYAPDAVLLATTSNTPRTNYAEIRDYYFNFLQRKPRVRNESRKIRIGCNVVTDVGVYSFTLNGPVSGTVATLVARYTFIYEQRDGAWLIVHHHSSAMPEPEAGNRELGTLNGTAGHKPEVAGFQTRRPPLAVQRSAPKPAGKSWDYYKPANSFNGSPEPEAGNQELGTLNGTAGRKPEVAGFQTRRPPPVVKHSVPKPADKGWDYYKPANWVRWVAGALARF